MSYNKNDYRVQSIMLSLPQLKKSIDELDDASFKALMRYVFTFAAYGNHPQYIPVGSPIDTHYRAYYPKLEANITKYLAKVAATPYGRNHMQPAQPAQQVPQDLPGRPQYAIYGDTQTVPAPSEVVDWEKNLNW